MSPIGRVFLSATEMTPVVASMEIGVSETVSVPFLTMDLISYFIPSRDPASTGASDEMAYPDSTSVPAGVYVSPTGSEVTSIVKASEKIPSSESAPTRYVVNLKSRTYFPGTKSGSFPMMETTPSEETSNSSSAFEMTIPFLRTFVML